MLQRRLQQVLLCHLQPSWPLTLRLLLACQNTGLLLNVIDNQLHPRFQLEKDEDYVALCDINEGMSCSK